MLLPQPVFRQVALPQVPAPPERAPSLALSQRLFPVPEILPRAPEPFPLQGPWQARETLPGLPEVPFSPADSPLLALALAPVPLAAPGLLPVQEPAAATSP